MFVLALVAIIILGIAIIGLLWLLSKFINNNQRNQPRQEPEMPPRVPTPRTNGLSRFEWGARFYVWTFGMFLAILTVLGVIPVIPPNTGLWLLILLIIFMFAMLVTWISDLRYLHPLRRRQQSENQNDDQR